MIYKGKKKKAHGRAPVKKLLFIGDLAPKYLTGTSISSSLILSELKPFYRLLIVEEDDSFQYKSFGYYLKVLNVSKKMVILFGRSLFNKISIFYLVFSCSGFGSIKSLLYILTVKLASPRAKVIIHIHRGDFFSSFFKRKRNQLVARMAFSFSTKVVLLSHEQCLEFSTMFPTRTFAVLKNTIEYEPVVTDFSILKRPRNKFVFVSNYFKEKGIIDLLQCFTELNKLGYDIELDTYGALNLSPIKTEILSFQSDKIRIHDSISGSEKRSLLRNSGCLVLPSWSEGQPLVILEAMANALPVIVSDVGYVAEMVGKDYQFLYKSRDVESLKLKIIEFLSLDKIKDIGQRLNTRYHSFYGKAKHKSNTVNIFTIE